MLYAGKHKKGSSGSTTDIQNICFGSPFPALSDRVKLAQGSGIISQNPVFSLYEYKVTAENIEIMIFL
jgi:hypothetical protein